MTRPSDAAGKSAATGGARLRRMLLPAAAAVAAALMLLPACSGGWDDRVVDGQAFQDHLAWVAAHMGVEAPAMPVILVSRSALARAVRESRHHTHLTRNRRAAVQGAYMPGLVLLDQGGFDTRNDWDVSFLVHELVHHVQQGSKRAYPCPHAREAEAYRLQNRWLQERGQQPMFTESFIAEMSRCRIAQGE